MRAETASSSMPAMEMLQTPTAAAYTASMPRLPRVCSLEIVMYSWPPILHGNKSWNNVLMIENVIRVKVRMAACGRGRLAHTKFRSHMVASGFLNCLCLPATATPGPSSPAWQRPAHRLSPPPSTSLAREPLSLPHQVRLTPSPISPPRLRPDPCHPFFRARPPVGASSRYPVDLMRSVFSFPNLIFRCSIALSTISRHAG